MLLKKRSKDTSKKDFEMIKIFLILESEEDCRDWRDWRERRGRKGEPAAAVVVKGKPVVIVVKDLEASGEVNARGEQEEGMGVVIAPWQPRDLKRFKLFRNISHSSTPPEEMCGVC